jgi:hypothetical protein
MPVLFVKVPLYARCTAFFSGRDLPRLYLISVYGPFFPPLFYVASPKLRCTLLYFDWLVTAAGAADPGALSLFSADWLPLPERLAPVHSPFFSTDCCLFQEFFLYCLSETYSKT